MIELKSPREIEQMRPASEFVAEVLTQLKAEAAVGVNLLDLEHSARDKIKRRGAESCYWDYAPSFGNGPFRNVICLSVNDAVLHGLPRDYTLRDGDLLSLDLAVSIGGWVGDAAISFVTGTPDPEDLTLIRATEEALKVGIEAAQVGSKIGDISAAVAEIGHSYGYTVNGEYGGHGVGRTMHEAPDVPNIGRAGRGLKLKPGLTFTIEPWFARTTNRVVHDKDGWTLKSADGSRTAHSEHTLAMTEKGPIVLTAGTGVAI